MLQLTDLAQRGFEIAKGIIEGGDEAQPVFMMVGADGKVGIVMTPFDGEASKVAIFQHMRGMMKATGGVVAYVFICEAWKSVYKSREEAKDAPPPSEDPDRVEILMIQGSDIHGKSLSWFAEIKRTDGVVEVVEPNRKTPDFAEGRAANLLAPEVFNLREVAREFGIDDQDGAQTQP